MNEVKNDEGIDTMINNGLLSYLKKFRSVIQGQMPISNEIGDVRRYCVEAASLCGQGEENYRQFYLNVVKRLRDTLDNCNPYYVTNEGTFGKDFIEKNTNIPGHVVVEADKGDFLQIDYLFFKDLFLLFGILF